jgi:hypothetical protein
MHTHQDVEHSEVGYRLTRTRASLDSIVYASWRGHVAESIAQALPPLTLEQVYRHYLTAVWTLRRAASSSESSRVDSYQERRLGSPPFHRW